MSAIPTIPTIRSAIISAVKSALNPALPLTVTTVHAYRRWWNDANKFKSLFTRTDLGAMFGKLNGWVVTRLRTTEREAPEWYRFYQLHRFELHGWFGIEDRGKTGEEIETVFQDQIETIRDNLRLNLSVFGDTEQTNPISQVLSIEPVTIGDSTFWYCLMEVVAEGIETKFS